MDSPSPPVKVLVADAQCLFAEALAVGLSQYPDLEVVGEYPTTGGEAVDAVIQFAPDVALIDFWIPGMKGPAAAAAIRAWAPDIRKAPRVLLLSWLHGRNQVQEALECGAIGFLPKSLRLHQVADAVRRAHDNEPLVYADELAKLVDDIEGRHSMAERRRAMLESLSSREVQILQALSYGGSRTVVARELTISVGTLKNHIHKILVKTDCTDLLEVLTMARYLGFIKEVGPPERDRR